MARSRKKTDGIAPSFAPATWRPMPPSTRTKRPQVVEISDSDDDLPSLKAPPKRQLKRKASTVDLTRDFEEGSSLELISPVKTTSKAIKVSSVSVKKVAPPPTRASIAPKEPDYEVSFTR
jgi:hypothetical protein